MKEKALDIKTKEQIHRLLALLPAFQSQLEKTAKLQREIAEIKLPLKRGIKFKSSLDTNNLKK